MSPILLQGGGAGVLFLLFGLLVFLVQIGIIVWIYSDAQQRSDQPAFLWAIVAFLAPLLGLVLYLIIGRNQY
ncbi:PLDc N-terminal domain-containing protein [Halorubrum salsamenti]|uniref:PLDc N-terminal domain-containing protein n=1 Tax=Halorubrum salsamenti TaxID=2583990 RepID=UPI0011AA0CA3|nr:PLDc N-terminal domain-containing protein [Halorubrum salsamenti]